MQNASIGGIHHVTAMASRPQPNVDFYVGALGMRLVKRSVNQDDPGTYHLFYADAVGHPGADLTFFPWAHIAPGRRGGGQIVEVPLTIPLGTRLEWRDRLVHWGLEPQLTELFGEAALSFQDPDGLALSLVESSDPREFTAWSDSPVRVDHQVRGIHAVRVWSRDVAPLHDFLTGVMGFSALGVDADWQRYALGGALSGHYLDMRLADDGDAARLGRGSVHHVAWRVADEPALLRARTLVAEAGLHPTPVIDRFWFRSVYFHIPGGILFELATDGPGFTVDEEVEALGDRLILPPWLEPERARIERALPPLGPPALEP